MAEFDSSWIYDDYGYDEKRNCWWARNSRGQMYRFEVEEVTATELGNLQEAAHVACNSGRISASA